MERGGAENIFKQYARHQKIEVRREAVSGFLARDCVFDVFGEGVTREAALTDLDAALEDYFDAVLGCDEEVVRRNVALAVSVISFKEEGFQCQTTSLY